MPINYHWKPIEPIPPNWQELTNPGLRPLFAIWEQQAEHLKASPAYQAFLGKMRREIAIETGVIERLYSIDRGITELLIEHGFDESLIPHGTTDVPSAEVIALIRDQEAALGSLFDFVGSNRVLTTSYIKELHALLTQNQSTVKARDPVSGELRYVPLLRGEWKVFPNNPSRDDGTVHEYTPPVQVSSEMDNLIAMYDEYQAQKMPPEILAAWLHHAFTQIHPFHDGNGRVARCLASLVFIKSGWFPLTITNDDRKIYIEALEHADRGSLKDLVALLGERQKQSFIRALGLSDQALSEHRQSAAILSSVREKLDVRKEVAAAARADVVDQISSRLLGRLQNRALKLKVDIKRTLSGIADTKISVRSALAGDRDRAQWNTIPIATVATALRYYANRRTYAAWIMLRIDVVADRTEILYSFHGLGPYDQGVRVIAPIAYKQEIVEGSHRQVTDIQPLSQSPFQYSYIEDAIEVEQRFDEWLEETILAGLSYWQRSL